MLEYHYEDVKDLVEQCRRKLRLHKAKTNSESSTTGAFGIPTPLEITQNSLRRRQSLQTSPTMPQTSSFNQMIVESPKTSGHQTPQLCNTGRSATQLNPVLDMQVSYHGLRNTDATHEVEEARDLQIGIPKNEYSEGDAENMIPNEDYDRMTSRGTTSEGEARSEELLHAKNFATPSRNPLSESETRVGTPLSPKIGQMNIETLTNEPLQMIKI
jgi:hypothetical protein